MSVRFRAAMLAAAVGASAAGAQSAPSALQRLTALDAKAIEAVERGDAVAVTIDTPDKTEVATLAVVRLDVPRAFYEKHVRELTGFLVSGAIVSSGSFGEPARLEDVASLALDAADARTLEKCQPLKCDVKLSAAEMEKFHAALAKEHDPAPLANSLMREWITDYVNAYRADSAEETVVYDDTKHPVRSSDAFRELLMQPMPAGIDSEPFRAMLAIPRAARPPGATSRISWSLSRLPGLKPTLEVVERSIYASPTRPDESWMATKLLYATHYFESQIDFITVTDAPSPAGPPASYLVVLRRQKFDDLPSGGLFNIRGRAVKRLREALRSTLASTRADLAKAYADSQATATHAP
jgi:hypothetical protein